jgi:hypothetical protein
MAALAVSLSYIPMAQADPVPTLSVSVQEDALGALTASSTTGVVSINNATYGDFVLNTVSGVGTPMLTSPFLDLQTLDVSTTGLATGHTLTIMLTQTGLTATMNSVPVISAFTGILSGVSMETVSSYYDPNNGAFAQANLLGTATFTAFGSNALNQPGIEMIPDLTQPFSETEIITATFDPNHLAPDTLNSSALIEAPAPEPASLALIGSGLLGVALIRRRRRSA